MGKIINLTRYAVNIKKPDGDILVIPPSGKTISIETSTECIGEVNGVPLYENKFVKASELPEEEPGTIYIVPAVVIRMLPDRKDLFVPCKIYRDVHGLPMYCLGLSRNG